MFKYNVTSVLTIPSLYFNSPRFCRRVIASLVLFYKNKYIYIKETIINKCRLNVLFHALMITNVFKFCCTCINNNFTAIKVQLSLAVGWSCWYINFFKISIASEFLLRRHSITAFINTIFSIWSGYFFSMLSHN